MLTETERLTVERIIHDAIGWALTKDIDRLFSIMAQDADALFVRAGLKRNSTP